MKVNWLGKAFLGAAGAYAAAKVFENATQKGDPTFTDAEVQAMADATTSNDPTRFCEIYRARRPWADEALLVSEWRMFCDKLL
jgi:hypothetical protein